MRPDILIVSNGPGELASWVRPVVRQFGRDFPEARLTVALVPCPYASGEEAATVTAWGEPVRVWQPAETMRLVLTGRAPEAISQVGAVLFLGGDQVFAALLSLRTGYPLLTYTEGAARWRSVARRFLLSDRQAQSRLQKRGYKPGQLATVGNLMVDAVTPRHDPLQIRRLLDLRQDALVLGMLPGSKPFKVRYVTPLFLRVAEILQARYPELQILLHRSPFTPREQLAEAVESDRYRAVTGGATGRLEREGTIDWIVTPGGARVQVVPPDMHYGGMGVVDLALTVPGTNTAELAILGVPMVVALPLHKPEEIPLDGLVGRLGSVPVLGPAVKRFLARRFEAAKPLVALPNQRAGRMITPERMGTFTPGDLANDVELLLADAVGRREIKLRLHEAMGAPGAARAIVSEVRSLLQRAPAPAPRQDSAAPHPQEP